MSVVEHAIVVGLELEDQLGGVCLGQEIQRLAPVARADALDLVDLHRGHPLDRPPQRVRNPGERLEGGVDIALERIFGRRQVLKTKVIQASSVLPELETPDYAAAAE